MLNLTVFASAIISPVLAQLDSDDLRYVILLLGPVGAGTLYWLLYRYYRNTHQSHKFEYETKIEAKPITGDDSKIRTIRGTQRRTIPGRNETDYRRRVNRVQ